MQLLRMLAPAIFAWFIYTLRQHQYSATAYYLLILLVGIGIGRVVIEFFKYRVAKWSSQTTYASHVLMYRWFGTFFKPPVSGKSTEQQVKHKIDYNLADTTSILFENEADKFNLWFDVRERSFTTFFMPLAVPRFFVSCINHSPMFFQDLWRQCIQRFTQYKANAKDLYSFIPFLSFRVKLFDEYFRWSLIKADVEQIIVIAAGYDSRAYRYQALRRKNAAGEDHLVPVYEIDLKEIQEEKKKALFKNVEEKYLKNVFYGSFNAEKLDLSDTLIKLKVNPNLRTAVVMEGLTYYISKVSIEFIFASLRCYFCTPDAVDTKNQLGNQTFPYNAKLYIMFDYIHSDFFNFNKYPWASDLCQKFRDADTPWISGYNTNEINTLLKNCGWTPRKSWDTHFLNDILQNNLEYHGFKADFEIIPTSVFGTCDI